MKTTKKHFKYFEKRVRYWQKQLNLENYDLRIRHDFIEDLAAGCSRNKNARHASIYLNTEWYDLKDNPLNNKILDKFALHECLELLLFDLVDMIGTRFMDAANIDPEKHNIIQILIKAILNNK